MTRKIIVTNTDYPYGAPNGTVMTVMHEGDYYVRATVDGRDDFLWYMKNHTFKEYPMKQDTPKAFGDMTPEEKGALLLAHHNGNTIEFTIRSSKAWVKTDDPSWKNLFYYRVKPEPKVETVAHFLDIDGLKKITFTVTDGVVSTTVKVEEV